MAAMRMGLSDVQLQRAEMTNGPSRCALKTVTVAMGCSQPVTECGRDTKTDPFWETGLLLTLDFSSWTPSQLCWKFFRTAQFFSLSFTAVRSVSQCDDSSSPLWLPSHFSFISVLPSKSLGHLIPYWLLFLKGSELNIDFFFLFPFSLH